MPIHRIPRTRIPFRFPPVFYNRDAEKANRSGEPPACRCLLPPALRKRRADTEISALRFGDPEGIRTPGPLLKRQLLCRLSYRVIYLSFLYEPHTCEAAFAAGGVAGTAGLEPADEGVKVPCLTTWRRPNRIRNGDRGRPDPRFSGVGDGTRTHNTWNHNPVLCQLNYTHHIVADANPKRVGTPEGTRTPGPLLRRQMLYPAELLAQMNGAGDENRTRIPSLEGWCPDHCATPA